MLSFPLFSPLSSIHQLFTPTLLINLILTRLLNNLKLLIIVAYKFGSSFVFPTPIVRKEKRLKEVMAADVPVSLLRGKLQKMRDEERFVFPGLRNRVVTAVNELEKILHILKASKPNHEIISISPQETSLQRTSVAVLPRKLRFCVLFTLQSTSPKVSFYKGDERVSFKLKCHWRFHHGHSYGSASK